jgi:PAS domain S-box-containing protein
MKPAERGSIRVLVVEDDGADLELIEAMLARSDLECRVASTATLEGVREHLGRGRFDVVLADHNLRGWQGMRVLAELRARGHDTPVILVTGTIGEERVVECLQEGATDCVLKGNLQRLPHAVHRALEEARLRREEATAREQIRRLSVAVDQGPAAVMITNTMGRIEYVNGRFTDITGYTEADALGANPRILRSGRTPLTLYEEMWHKISHGEAWRGELMNRRKNGELFWTLSSISPRRCPTSSASTAKPSSSSTAATP